MAFNDDQPLVDYPREHRELSKSRDDYRDFARLADRLYIEESEPCALVVTTFTSY